MFDRCIDGLGWLVILFILGPLAVIVGGSFTTTPYLSFPPTGLTLRWYAQLLTHGEFLVSFFDTIEIAVACTLAATLLGVLAAFGLHRHSGRGRESLRAIVMSPLILPTIVTGVTLMQFFNRIALLPSLLALIIGHTLITIPYVVRTVGAALVGFNQSIEEAAESLGAGALRVILRITIPAVTPAILSSLIFVFVTSFDQVTVSIFLSTADVMPLPVRIYNYIDYSIDPMAAAVSTLLILFGFFLVWVFQKLLGLDRAFGINAR